MSIDTIDQSKALRKWAAKHPGVLAISVKNDGSTVRLTTPEGAAIDLTGQNVHKDLVHHLKDRSLWAADATMLTARHRTLLADLNVKCAMTLHRALEPGLAPIEPPTLGLPTANLVAGLQEHPAAAKRAALNATREECLWRPASQRGYRVDRQALAIERQRLERIRQAGIVTHGVDLMKADDDTQRWLAAHDIRVVPDKDTMRRGFSLSVKEVDGLTPEAREHWDAYRTVRSHGNNAGALQWIARGVKGDGRVYPTILTNPQASGRMSWRGVSMQGVPANLRYLFLAPDDLSNLVGLDHSGAEMRVIAAASGCPALRQSVLFGNPYQELAEVSDVQLKEAKIALLAWAYGQGLSGLTAKVGAEAAIRIRESIPKLWPDVQSWLNDAIARAKRGDALQTLTGRNLPPRPGDDARLAPNLIIQGSARDYFGEGIRRTAEALGAHALWLAIHDELIVTAPRGESQSFADTLREAMTIDLGNGIQLTGSPVIFGPRWRNKDG